MAPMTGRLAPAEGSNLLILDDPESQTPSCIEFNADGRVPKRRDDAVLLVELFADWVGQTKPLVKALQGSIPLPVRHDDKKSALVRLVGAEMERGAAETGLLADLADARISKAIVAMHENPGRSWCNDELADLAGI